MQIVPSDNCGMLFCIGCFTQMGADVPGEICSFGDDGKLVWVNFRNLTGPTEKFVETFPDEGNTDMFAVMNALAAVGYEVFSASDRSASGSIPRRRRQAEAIG